MIKLLTEQLDKVEMISLIKWINTEIHNFFAKTKVTKITNDENNNIININGHWGSGKSTLVNNLEIYYKQQYNDDKIFFKIFNLWEYEIYENPYLYILIDICYEIGILKHKKWLKIFKKILKAILTTGYVAISLYLSSQFNMSTSDFPKNENNSANKITDILNERTAINKLINTITNFISESKNKFVIILDELDRCNNKNATRILSHIKNIFLKVPNIFYILSSNNYVINSYIQQQIGPIKNQSKNEYYMDKMFNKSIDLDLEYTLISNTNYLLTSNYYINNYISIMNLTDLRLINKINKQINYIFKNINLNLKDYLTKESDIKLKLELLLFYCYFLKEKYRDDYINILKALNNKFLNTNNEFYLALKKLLFSEEIKHKKIILAEHMGVLQNPKILYNNLYINKTKETNGINFYLLMPIFWHLIKLENVNIIFQKNDEYFQDNKIYNLNLKNITNLPEYCKKFIEIMINDFYFNTESFLGKNAYLNKFMEEFNNNISFDYIKYLIEQTKIDIN